MFGSIYCCFQNLQRIYLEKLEKCLKIAKSRWNIKTFWKWNETWWFVILGVLHTENQSPRSKTVAYKPYFEAKFDFSTKSEVVFKVFTNGLKYPLAILQSPYMPNFKSLCCLVWSTGAFIINKGYIRKNPKMSKNSHK